MYFTLNDMTGLIDEHWGLSRWRGSAFFGCLRLRIVYSIHYNADNNGRLARVGVDIYIDEHTLLKKMKGTIFYQGMA